MNCMMRTADQERRRVEERSGLRLIAILTSPSSVFPHSPINRGIFRIISRMTGQAVTSILVPFMNVTRR